MTAPPLALHPYERAMQHELESNLHSDVPRLTLEKGTLHHGPFGSDRFGRAAERFARFFGTPRFIIGQTVAVVVWIGLNGLAFANGWDPYPFILLNLAFSTQAAYAAPLILLAQTRQADRDKAHEAAATTHREELHGQLVDLIAENTHLTEEVHALAESLARAQKTNRTKRRS